MQALCVHEVERKREDAQAGCFASAKEPSFFTPQIAELHIHTPPNTQECVLTNTGCRMRGDLSSPTFTDAQRAVRFKYGRRHTLVLTHQAYTEEVTGAK